MPRAVERLARCVESDCPDVEYRKARVAAGAVPRRGLLTERQPLSLLFEVLVRSPEGRCVLRPLGVASTHQVKPAREGPEETTGIRRPGRRRHDGGAAVFDPADGRRGSAHRGAACISVALLPPNGTAGNSSVPGRLLAARLGSFCSHLRLGGSPSSPVSWLRRSLARPAVGDFSGWPFGKASLLTQSLCDLFEFLRRVVRSEDRRLGGQVMRGCALDDYKLLAAFRIRPVEDRCQLEVIRLLVCGPAGQSGSGRRPTRSHRRFLWRGADGPKRIPR
jgi:hypothetical protein